MKRFSMLVDDGVVKQLNVEAPGKFEVSDAETMLRQLRLSYPRARLRGRAPRHGEVPVIHGGLTRRALTAEDAHRIVSPTDLSRERGRDTKRP